MKEFLLHRINSIDIFKNIRYYTKKEFNSENV